VTVNDKEFSTVLTGGCVCGEVRFCTDRLPLRTTACHCSWCQRRTGAAFGAECVFPFSAIVLEGNSLSSYRHYSDLSGRWIEQDFCSNCGCNMGLRLEVVPELRSLALGGFDDTSAVTGTDIPLRHVFLRSRLSVCDIPQHAERYQMHFRD